MARKIQEHHASMDDLHANHTIPLSRRDRNVHCTTYLASEGGERMVSNSFRRTRYDQFGTVMYETHLMKAIEMSGVFTEHTSFYRASGDIFVIDCFTASISLCFYGISLYYGETPEHLEAHIRVARANSHWRCWEDGDEGRA